MRPYTLLIALLLLASCADRPALPPDAVLASVFTKPPAGSLVVFLPPEADYTEFEPGLPLLQEQMHRQLQAAGYAVAVLGKESSDTAWNQEVLAVGGIFDPVTGVLKKHSLAEALSAFSRRIAAETQASLIVRPRLVLRKAQLEGTKADWDGQLRLVPVRGLAGGSARHSGTVPALSVELLALSPNGELAFRTFGGIALPFQSNLSSERNELRDDIFASGQEMAEGVSIALKPIARSLATPR